MGFVWGFSFRHVCFVVVVCLVWCFLVFFLFFLFFVGGFFVVVFFSFTFCILFVWGFFCFVLFYQLCVYMERQYCTMLF